MFDKPIYNYPLEKILEGWNTKRGDKKDFWHSPLRDEKDASLHVDQRKNLWYDHGIGIGGTNVKLVQMVMRCSKEEAEKYIASLSPGLDASYQEGKNQQKEAQIKSRIERVQEIRNYNLCRYLDSRKIPLDLANRYCKEVVLYSPTKKKYFSMLGFPNNAGGYAMSSPNGFKLSTGGGPTIMNHEGTLTQVPTTEKVAVFEGYFDFLSWQVMQNNEKPSCDTVVLNSVSNIQKAADYIQAHDTALCFLDNDKAGQTCLNTIQAMMGKEQVRDMSILYNGHKDLNEMLQESRGYNMGTGIKRVI